MSKYMRNLAELLKPIELSLDELLLDPNNPRFSELGEKLNTVLESRFAEDNVQAAAVSKMRSGNFDVAELRDTIQTIGFLPMDRIVVRRWNGPADADAKYVVIEGNRRVTALKWIMELHHEGKLDLTTSEIANYNTLECLLLQSEDLTGVETLILPGLRHVSGIKEWGPYQKAKAVYNLRESGMSAKETAQSLGLSTLASNNAYRCFLSLENMKKDEEFGELASPRLYSFFEEIFKKPAVKTWLSWDDNQGRFQKEDHLSEFYGWIVPVEPGEDPKLTGAKEIRELARVMSSDSAFSIFRAPNGTLTKALTEIQIAHPEDWHAKIATSITALKSLTPDNLRQMDSKTESQLEDLIERIKSVLADRAKLTS